MSSIAVPGSHAEPIEESIAVGGFANDLKVFSLLFSVFLLVFPPLAVVYLYFTESLLVVSLPLFVMCVCGLFGTKLSWFLKRRHG